MDTQTRIARHAVELQVGDVIESDDPCDWVGRVERVTSDGGRTTVRILCDGDVVRETYDSYGQTVYIARAVAA